MSGRHAPCPDTPFREEFACSKLLLRQADAVWLVTSPFWPHYVQLAIRAALAAFTITTIIMGGKDQGDVTWFIYLTNWTYLLVTLACLGFLLLSMGHAWREATCEDRSEEELAAAQVAWRWYHSLQQILFTLAITASILVTVLQWSLLGGPADFLLITFHGVNAAITVLELVTSHFKLNILHGVYAVLAAVIYVVFSAVYTSKTHVSIYPVLDWFKDPKGSAALAVPVSLIAPLVIHALAYCLSKLRMKIGKHSPCLSNTRSTQYQLIQGAVAV